jgi:uncharacterized repeat protein (TIGR01451 family)
LPNPGSVDTLKWNYFNLKPLDTASIIVYGSLKPPPLASIGDTTISTAIITSDKTDLAPFDNVAKLVQVLRGSYDPNDKTESHGGSILKSVVANGEYLQYLIRFQNTGTDTAFNVYIRDTLDSKLDWSSFRMIETSHSYQLNITGGSKCLWTFSNIELVDSFKNEPLSHGYISFIIKPKPTVQIGDVIRNTASIYFDYNLPVVTNTETTTIVNEALPVRLLAFIAKREGRKNLLQWNTSNEVDVDRFEIERSTDGREFSHIGKVKAGASKYDFIDHSPVNSHNYYRLKMLDKDGRFVYSPVRMINNAGSFYVNIYPNPAKDKLQLQIESEKKAELNVQVVTISGKVISSRQIVAQQGTSVQAIPVHHLQAGSYFLRVTGSGKEQVVVKLEKL